MSISKHVCNTLTHKGPRSHYVPNTQKQSHSALFSRSYNFFSFLSSLTKVVELKEVSSYNNGGGGNGPSNNGKRAYPLEQFLFLGNKKPKGEFLDHILKTNFQLAASRNFQSWKLFFYLKNFPKEARHESDIRTEPIGAGLSVNLWYQRGSDTKRKRRP